MENLYLLDCTLRDGANVVGNGFDAELTKLIIEGLIASNVKEIEFGNAKGLGAYQSAGAIAPLNDAEYMDLVQPYLSEGNLGMFVLANNINEENISLTAKKGLNFLRVGTDAGDGESARAGIELIKKHKLKCRFSLMKAYLSTAEELAEEAAMLESFGIDEITIMDSAGTMTPDQVEAYVSKMVEKVNIPVGFHGHNNLGLSSANALVAVDAGATSIDCGLMGMARSAGNCTTEMIAAIFQRDGKLESVDLFNLLNFIDQQLEPTMKNHNYHNAVSPLNLVYGLSGCHSSFEKRYKQIAKEKNVDLYQLIIETSKVDRKAPTESLIERIAETLKSPNHLV